MSTVRERIIKTVAREGEGRSILGLPSCRDTISLAGRGSDTKNWDPPDGRTRSSRDSGTAPLPKLSRRVSPRVRVRGNAHARNKSESQ